MTGQRPELTELQNPNQVSNHWSDRCRHWWSQLLCNALNARLFSLFWNCFYKWQTLRDSVQR